MKDNFGILVTFRVGVGGAHTSCSTWAAYRVNRLGSQGYGQTHFGQEDESRITNHTQVRLDI